MRITGKMKSKIKMVLRHTFTAAAAVACLAATAGLLPQILRGTGFSLEEGSASGANVALMDRFDTYVVNQLSDALDGVVAIEKHYWLSDEDIVAPEPNPECFGQSDDPAQLQWLLDKAGKKLNVTDTLFTTQTRIKSGSQVNYYLDDTIFCVTWKQVENDAVYTISEVKIADPSQFRRFLADGTYGSEKQYTTSEMAASVNAVVASSGDFYKYRGMGVIVYNRQVQRANYYLDVCYIDDNGDMLFSRRGQMDTVEQAQAFVEEKNIRFSLAFGPVLVEDSALALPGYYDLGEPGKSYSRAALAQLGELHYLLVTVNYDGHYHVPTIEELAHQMLAFGVENAYALDGGQTATLVMNGQLMNQPDYGAERKISDIIYFATAIPSDGAA